jgi:molecular chaperone DnaK (HSP70)
MRLFDSTTFSLGIETENDGFQVIIPKCTSIPCTKSKTVSNSLDGQTNMSISVYEGEEENASNNNFLGEFNLKGITPAPRGETKVDVKFSVDFGGVLEVTAVEPEAKTRNSVTINKSNGFSTQDMNNMIEKFSAYK